MNFDSSILLNIISAIMERDERSLTPGNCTNVMIRLNRVEGMHNTLFEGFDAVSVANFHCSIKECLVKKTDTRRSLS